MMDADEREIYHYLKPWKEEFLSSREICRRAGGKRRFRRDEEWAKPVLTRMLEKGIVETDTGGHFRLKPMPGCNGQKAKRCWVSPTIARVLKQSGKDFGVVIIEEEEDVMDKYYDGL